MGVNRVHGEVQDPSEGVQRGREPETAGGCNRQKVGAHAPVVGEEGRKRVSLGNNFRKWGCSSAYTRQDEISFVGDLVLNGEEGSESAGATLAWQELCLLSGEKRFAKSTHGVSTALFGKMKSRGREPSVYNLSGQISAGLDPAPVLRGGGGQYGVSKDHLRWAGHWAAGRIV
eukprot:5536821-Amphidinium_carterae.1